MLDRTIAVLLRPENRSRLIIGVLIFFAISYLLTPSGSNLYRNVTGLEIVPGATWTAGGTDLHIQAHGPGIIKVDDFWYMIGEDKTGNREKGHFQHVNCYSSQDLVDWKFENHVLTRDNSIPALGPNRIVERPKVLWNERTKSFVMIMHIDNEIYKNADIGFANSTEVCGRYQWQRQMRPLGHESRDISLFQEEDGQAYLLSEDRPNGLHIFKLTYDYMHVSEVIYSFAQNIESPALIKRNGIYYLFGSHLTGWNHNDNVYATATDLTGPWSSWQKFAPEGSNTFESQTSFVLPVGKELVIYGGDRWVPKNLQSSSYVWLPLQISGTSVTMPSDDPWLLDAKNGRASPAPPPRWFEAEHATLEKSAKVVQCKKCSGHSAVGRIGGRDDGVLVFSDLRFSTAGRKTFQIEYWFSGLDERSARVNLHVGGNGETRSKVVSFLPVSPSQNVGISVVHLDVPAGTHSLSIEGVQDMPGPEIDRVGIPK